MIRYAVGRENEARVYEGTEGHNGQTEDSLAIMHALGKLIGDLTGLNGEDITAAIIQAASKKMVAGMIELMFGGKD